MSKQVKLVHLTTVPETLRVLSGQLSYMRSRGFLVEAISSPGEQLKSLGETIGMKTHAVAMTRAISPVQDIISVLKLVRLFREIKPQIVHAHTPKAGLLGMLAAYITDTPIRIYHIRGLRLETAIGWKRKLLAACESVACRLAQRVLCVSRSVRQVAIDEKLVTDEKIKVLLQGSHGVDALNKFTPDQFDSRSRFLTRKEYDIPESAEVIGFVGRIVKDKGIVELCDAWIEIRETNPKAHLLMVGYFEPEDPIPEEAQRLLESDPRIHMIGRCWDTPPLFAAMDVLCLPTYREGLPYVTLEAAAMALPIVATEIPGCVDAVVDGKTGLLVPARNSIELADALKTYLDYPALRRQHGQAGRDRVLKDFRPEDMWQATHEEYLRLLTEQKIPHPEIPEVESTEEYKLPRAA